MSLTPQVTLQAFDKWVVDFVRPISLPRKMTSALYIITTTDYLTRWAEVATIKDRTAAIAVNFLFDNDVT